MKVNRSELCSAKPINCPFSCDHLPYDKLSSKPFCDFAIRASPLPKLLPIWHFVTTVEEVFARKPFRPEPQENVRRAKYVHSGFLKANNVWFCLQLNAALKLHRAAFFSYFEQILLPHSNMSALHDHSFFNGYLCVCPQPVVLGFMKELLVRSQLRFIA